MKLFVFPGQMRPEVLEAGGGQLPYARTEEFSGVVKYCCESTLELLGCSGGRMVVNTSTGSGAMEAAVANLLEESDRVLVIVTGDFGARWATQAALYCEVDDYEVPFGGDIDFEKLAELLKTGRYRAVLMQHHETSSGALYDIKRVAGMVKAVGGMVFVDAISSFLADSISMDEMGLDVVILSSHKGLCIPPGLGMVALADGVEMRDRTSQFWNFRDHLESLERGQPLYSPPVQLYQQWKARLEILMRENRGVTELGRVREKSAYFRELLRDDGREMLPESPSNCLTSFQVEVDGRLVCDLLRNEGWYILPSRLAKQVRVSHIGETTIDDHRALYELIKSVEKTERSRL